MDQHWPYGRVLFTDLGNLLYDSTTSLANRRLGGGKHGGRLGDGPQRQRKEKSIERKKKEGGESQGVVVQQGRRQTQIIQCAC